MWVLSNISVLLFSCQYSFFWPVSMFLYILPKKKSMFLYLKAISIMHLCEHFLCIASRNRIVVSPLNLKLCAIPRYILKMALEILESNLWFRLESYTKYPKFHRPKRCVIQKWDIYNGLWLTAIQKQTILTNVEILKEFLNTKKENIKGAEGK